DKYEHISGQQSITDLEKSLLVSERASREKIETKLIANLKIALESGVGFFKALKFDAGDLGRYLSNMIRAICDRAVPDLYSTVDMGCRPMDGSEPEELLKQANLNNLPPLFHGS